VAMMAFFNRIPCFVVVMLIAALSGYASAANIYVKGTTADQMYRVVAPVLGDQTTPVFFVGSDGLRFLRDLDGQRVRDAGLTADTFRYYYGALKGDASNHGVLGYILGGIDAPGNEKYNASCAIVVSNEGALRTTRTYFHEAIHCRTTADLRLDKQAWMFAKSLNKNHEVVSAKYFMSYFHEVLAAYLQVAHSANNHIEDGRSMIEQQALLQTNAAESIGFRTARSALRLCGIKNACPTDTAALIRYLSENESAVNEFNMDILELHKAAIDSGYVVADH
jgi:hypothetical protein